MPSDLDNHFNEMNKHELLNILYQERERLNQKYNYPGWNSWAILAAIGTIVWTLISLNEVNKIQIPEVISIFLISYSLYYLSLVINGIFIEKDRNNHLNESRFEYLGNHSHLLNPYLFFYILLFGVIIYYNTNYTYLTGFHFLVFKGLYILQIAFFILNIALSNVEIPIQKKPKFGLVGKILLFGILALPWTYIIHGLFLNLGNNWFQYFDSIKYGLLIFSLYFLVSRYIIVSKPNRLLFEVDNLIHSLLFDKKETKEVINELEILLLGLEIKTIFEKPLTKFFEHLKSFENKCERVIDNIDEFEQMDFSNLRDHESAEKVMNRRKDRVDLVLLNVNRAKDEFIKVETEFNRITRLLGYVRVNENSQSDLSKVTQSMKEKLHVTKEKWNILYQRVLQIEEKNQAWSENFRSTITGKVN